MSNISWTDKDIVQFIIQGGESQYLALEVFCKKHYYLIENIIPKILKEVGSTVPPEEAFNEAFFTFRQNILSGKFKDSGSLKNYFLGILKNQQKEAKKKIHRRQGLLEKRLYFDTSLNLEDKIIDNDISNIVNSAIAIMEEDCKKILRLKKTEYSLKEIMKELNIKSYFMVKKKSAKCIKKLKQYLLTYKKLLSNMGIKIKH